MNVVKVKGFMFENVCLWEKGGGCVLIKKDRVEKLGRRGCEAWEVVGRVGNM